jgi:hypothetical protein
MYTSFLGLNNIILPNVYVSNRVLIVAFNGTGSEPLVTATQGRGFCFFQNK